MLQQSCQTSSTLTMTASTKGFQNLLKVYNYHPKQLIPDRSVPVVGTVSITSAGQTIVYQFRPGDSLLGPALAIRAPEGPKWSEKEVQILFPHDADARMVPGDVQINNDLYAIIHDPDAEGSSDDENPSWTIEETSQGRRYMIPMAKPDLLMSFDGVRVNLRAPWMILARRVSIPQERKEDFHRAIALLFQGDDEIEQQDVIDSSKILNSAGLIPRPQPPETAGRNRFRKLVNRVRVRRKVEDPSLILLGPAPTFYKVELHDAPINWDDYEPTEDAVRQNGERPANMPKLGLTVLELEARRLLKLPMTGLLAAHEQRLVGR
ncbi:uncharacterized protein BDZ99DRAFT_220989 [Mytilinidion resinicola]|uniref:Uncharacterized protein n=1 Tax=Mytilinidion resinicola TaxID=574789 RepID=A0A6A6XYY0_9PEZI|nr:uncharacterized protein BDZ99DRAFT_220989 [Mytilinidion resinicola]KAF2801463.1 hypothetical protein BDZ99DRAFT_220989 [Mytilinidion resinicola]